MSQAGTSTNAFALDSDSTVIRGFVINRLVPASTVTPAIRIRRGVQNIIEGNYIGTDLSGTLDMADLGSDGIHIHSSNNLVGGTTPAARNLLSGLDTGIQFSTAFSIQPSTGNNSVQGNFIGTNASGTAGLSNTFQANRFFGLEILSPNNTIGGTSAGARNLISRNQFSGIDILGANTTGNLIQGNFIGTDVTGTIPISIGLGNGVSITSGASSNTVGGSTVAARNLISGNSNGVAIGTSGAINSTPSNTVQGNFIGTEVSGTTPLANNTAIIVPANVVGSQINDNRIAFNNSAAVQIRELGGNDAPGIRVSVFENEIYANGFGIDLGPSGITPNDFGDGDGGANLRQNFPVLTSFAVSAPIGGEGLASNSSGVPPPVDEISVSVNGTLNSTPNTTFTVHWYFSADAQCVANQAGSSPLVTGRVPSVITDVSGNAPFSFPFDLPVGINNGIINCTATDSQGNTSEFSACLPVSSGGGPTPTPTPTPTPMTIQFTSDVASVAENGGSATVTVSRMGNNSGVATVDYATSNTAGLANCNVLNSGNASSRCDYATAIGRLRFAAGETSKTISVLVVDDGYGEGNEQFIITLSNSVGASLGALSTATVTINDNETVNGVNPINQAGFFVREHYLDFFSREPDASGLAFWTNQITSCGTDTACIELRRINVSAAFFLSIEFQQTGYLVYRMYKAAYGNLPAGAPVPVTFNEFLPDTQRAGRGGGTGGLGAGVREQQESLCRRLRGTVAVYHCACNDAHTSSVR